jgi:hypothetical protein
MMPALRNKPKGTRSTVRLEPPTLDDAIFAAQGLAEDVEGQTQIAAMLMGLPEAEVRVAVSKAAVLTSRAYHRPSLSSRQTSERPAIVVERRAPRTLMR